MMTHTRPACLQCKHMMRLHLSLLRLLCSLPWAICWLLPALVSCQGKVQLLTNPVTWTNVSASSWASSDVWIFCTNSCNFCTPLVRVMQGLTITFLVRHKLSVDLCQRSLPKAQCSCSPILPPGLIPLPLLGFVLTCKCSASSLAAPTHYLWGSHEGDL